MTRSPSPCSSWHLNGIYRSANTQFVEAEIQGLRTTCYAKINSPDNFDSR